MIRNIFKPSAKNKNSAKWIWAQKSLIKILNNRGPKVEPRGTNNSTVNGEEDFLKMRTKNLDD
jgi:hypothetical protein